jgi:hypothetical protein
MNSERIGGTIDDVHVLRQIIEQACEHKYTDWYTLNRF